MSTSVEPTPRPQEPRLIRNIAQYINRSLCEWYMFQPHLHHEAGTAVSDIWGAFMSVAVAHARILVANFQILNGGPGLDTFLRTHCEEQFHFPRMPPIFAASAFLTKVSPQEWNLIADELEIPHWLEAEVIAWGTQQGLLLKNK